MSNIEQMWLLLYEETQNCFGLTGRRKFKEGFERELWPFELLAIIFWWYKDLGGIKWNLVGQQI